MGIPACLCTCVSTEVSVEYQYQCIDVSTYLWTYILAEVYAVYHCIGVSIDVHIGWSICSVSLYRRIYERVYWLKYVQCISLSVSLYQRIYGRIYWLKYMHWCNVSVSVYHCIGKSIWSCINVSVSTEDGVSKNEYAGVSVYICKYVSTWMPV
jgi:hypothetical protein